MKVLIIDDDSSMRQFYRKLMQDADFEVVVAANGKEGIELYRSSPCDMVITDLFMPEMDGLEVIQTLRQEFPNVRVIALSGGPSESACLSCSSSSADLEMVTILRKSFDTKMLMSAVNSALHLAAL